MSICHLIFLFFEIDKKIFKSKIRYTRYTSNFTKTKLLNEIILLTVLSKILIDIPFEISKTIIKTMKFSNENSLSRTLLDNFRMYLITNIIFIKGS